MRELVSRCPSRLWSGLVVAVLAAGCSSSPPVRLYVLSPEASASASPISADFAVGIGPVTLAPHLDRPQIVTRDGHELHLGEFDRWAEPLAEGIAGALAENLSALLDTERVWIYPWRPSQKVDLQVMIDVLRCDLEAGEAIFEARWTILDGDELRAVERSSFREPASDAASAAPALSRSLATLSREIGERLLSFGAE